MNTPINRFNNEYFFLSNMYGCKVEYKGLIFDNSESAYQSEKTSDMFIKVRYLGKEGKESKKISKSVIVREGFHKESINIMYSICKAKFTQNKELGDKLKDTYPRELIEGNWWKDTFWGVYNGKGNNYLGKILMIIRDELLAGKY